MRWILLFVLSLLVVGCGGNKSRPASGGAGQAAGAPYVGFSTTSGPTDQLMGTASALSGQQFWLSTSATNLPAVGAYGEVSWILDRKVGPFGKGVIMSLGEVQVKQVQPPQAGMMQQMLLELTKNGGEINFNGQRMNTIEAGKQVRLTYRR